MEKIFVEENGVYSIDFTQARWATNEIHDIFHRSGVFLSDVDFVAESDDMLLLVEYKNSNIPQASNPEGFCPAKDKYIDKIARKFYDTYFYLKEIGKGRTATYVYILDYPNADSVTNDMVRNKIARKLPFQLQEGFIHKCLDRFEVLSIDEWNEKYSQYPLRSLNGD